MKGFAVQLHEGLDKEDARAIGATHASTNIKTPIITMKSSKKHFIEKGSEAARAALKIAEARDSIK